MIARRVTVAIALLLLTGCTGGEVSPSPEASSTPTPTPSASPSVSASVTPSPVGGCPIWSDDPDLGLAAIDYNRFGGICVGMSFADASAASGIPISGESMCPWYTNIVAMDDLGYYVTALSPVESPGSEIWFFRMTWYNDPALATSYEMPRTAEGITIGSTEAELLAVYPGATSITFDDYARGPRTQRLVPGPDGLTYVFDINGGVVTEITWGLNLTSGAQGEYCAL